LIRVKIDATKATPDFVTCVINSRIGRQQIDALSRQIIGQANVNSEELRSLQLPLPPLDVQKAIMHRLKSGDKRSLVSGKPQTAENRRLK
jgi:type I restriction enzyme S subunit